MAIVSETISVTLGTMIRDFIRGEAKDAGGLFAERIRKVIKENPRADLLYILLTLDSDEASKLWARHGEAIREGVENKFVLALGQVIPRTPDGKIDTDRAKKIFEELAKMDENLFCQTLEELDHDPIAQKIRHWLIHGKGFAEALAETMGETCGQLSANAEDAALRINEGTNNPGWFGRVARKLIR